jgi:hypothetical protein
MRTVVGSLIMDRLDIALMSLNPFGGTLVDSYFYPSTDAEFLIFGRLWGSDSGCY